MIFSYSLNGAENHKVQQQHLIEVGLVHGVEDYTLLPAVQRLSVMLMGKEHCAG
jgi:hypothetical protein